MNCDSEISVEKCGKMQRRKNWNAIRKKIPMRGEKLRVRGMRKPRGIGAEINFQSFLGGVKDPQAIRAARQVP
jgi:hypothetical protein